MHNSLEFTCGKNDNKNALGECFIYLLFVIYAFISFENQHNLVNTEPFLSEDQQKNSFVAESFSGIQMLQIDCRKVILKLTNGLKTEKK